MNRISRNPHQSPRSISSRRRRPLLVEQVENRQLLAGGPLTVTITELGTSNSSPQSLTIVDGDENDASPIVGRITYSTPAVSPFTDFKLEGFTAASNRATATTIARLNTNGLIKRTTTSGGDHVLQILVSDTGFTSPTNPSTLTSSASATFTNPTASDQGMFQSFANATASPAVILKPIGNANPQAKAARRTRRRSPFRPRSRSVTATQSLSERAFRLRSSSRTRPSAPSSEPIPR